MQTVTKIDSILMLLEEFKDHQDYFGDKHLTSEVRK